MDFHKQWIIDELNLLYGEITIEYNYGKSEGVSLPETAFLPSVT